MTKYYEDESFERMILSLSDTHATPSFGGVWVGPMNEENLQIYEDMYNKEKARLQQMELGISLIKIANKLGIQFKE